MATSANFFNDFICFTYVLVYNYAWQIEALEKTLGEEEDGLKTLLAEIDALKVILFTNK